MSEQKRVLLADNDKMGRLGKKLACMDLENVEFLSAETGEEALSVINSEPKPDLVVLDPMLDLHRGRLRGHVDVGEGTLGVMTWAISKGIRVLIITTLPEKVEQELLIIGMQNYYEEIVEEATGPEATSDAVCRALDL